VLTIRDYQVWYDCIGSALDVRRDRMTQV